MKIVLSALLLFMYATSTASPHVYVTGFAYQKNLRTKNSSDSGVLNMSMAMNGLELLDIDRQATLDSINIKVGENKLSEGSVSYNSPPSVSKVGAAFEFVVKNLNSKPGEKITINGKVFYYVSSGLKEEQTAKLKVAIGESIQLGTWMLTLSQVSDRKLTFEVNKNPQNMQEINFYKLDGTRISSHFYSRQSAIINGQGHYSISFELNATQPILLVGTKTNKVTKDVELEEFSFAFTTPY